ncbi:MAG: ATP-binding protein, partial [Symploca sp. SIO2B6]|nr:ATP-binding protein [Symploca sp. SIO2B6]
MVVHWHKANQQYLMGAIDQIRYLLQQHVEPFEGMRPVRPPDPTEIIFPEQECSAADALSHIFRLSSFERDILLLCAGVELSRPIADLCGKLNGNPMQSYATFSLALAIFPEIHWNALTPEAPLRRWRLIEVGGGTALTISPLRIDEQILHYLMGTPQLDNRLNGVVLPVHAAPIPRQYLPPSYQTVVQDIIETSILASAPSPSTP